MVEETNIDDDEITDYEDEFIENWTDRPEYDSDGNPNE